jgi:signal transduction histidine kinase
VTDGVGLGAGSATRSAPSAPLQDPAASRLRTAAAWLAVTAAYFVAGKLGLRLAFVNESATAVWPPTGIALAACLILGNRAWPAVFAGAFLVNLTTAGGFDTTIGIALGNTLETVLGATLVRRLAGGRRAFERARDIFRFVIVVLCATMVAASVGTTSLALGGQASWSDYASIWLTWWLGDATGAAIATPFLLLWIDDEPRWAGRRLWESAVLLVVTLLVGQIVFGGAFSRFGVPNYPLTFLCIPLLVWPAFRLGRREAATLVVVLCGLAIRGTLRGLGPFATGDPNESLLLLQAFMGTIAVTTLSVAAVVRERARGEDEQKALRETAELERARLEAVVRHMPMGVVIAEAPSGRMILGNDQVERICRRPFQAASSIGAYAAFNGYHEDGRLYAPDEWPLARSIRTGEVVLGEEIGIVRGDGTQGTISVSSAPIRDARGRIAAAVAIFGDVSDAKEAELSRAQLLAGEQAARAEAEAANRAKDEFLAVLGHELRNPLGAAINAVAVLERLEQQDEQVLRARRVIARQIRHFARLVDDLLDVARVTTGKIALRRGPVELAEAARRCVGTLTTAGVTGSHALTLDLEPVWVEGDAALLEQVITNLLTNAVRYTPPGGEVTLRVGRKSNEAWLEVRDSGIGIDPDVRDRIFELFIQGARPPHSRQGGFGIGLTLVRRLVELHGGEVQAASAGPGLGSVFTVRLPAISPPITGKAEPGRSQLSRRRRILVVEDNEDGLEMLRTVLELSGHEVHEARDGPQGLETARRVEPEVAVVDIDLPGFDGYEVARRIRALPEATPVRLVALTGYGQPEDRQRAMDAGFDAHLVKPVDPRKLLEIVAAPADGV